ncbi:putative ribonuclease H-like domain-containing protein [Tanacetum coccineum]|uniref:Ribonuclease H-like domain-containing protein n=1 Tax=Tanacetum coccineum TaxID=301880 RepID=A0ABQ4XRY2_9ASTR
MPKNQLALTRPRLSSSIAITHGTLLESADQKEIKKAEEEMQGTLDIEQNTMGGDLENRRPKASAIQAQTLSFSHLIRDCDFHEKRIAKHVELNKKKGKGTGQGENRPLLLARHILSSKAAKLVHTRALKNKEIVDSGCSRYMTGNKAYLAEYQDYNGGPVTFGGSKGYITGKGKIKIEKLDFEDVCFVKELQHFNLFSVSQISDKKNKVLFTDTECLVLPSDFKLPDENQVLLRIPRQNNMYNFNLENIVPSGGLACLIAKATVDESNKWHRRLGHVNFKNLNKLMKGNLVRGLPLKIFQNDHICVACQKGKQHKASCKAKIVSSISQPLQLLHMDLFGPTSVKSINHKTYCLVITDDFSRFRTETLLNSVGQKGSRGSTVQEEPNHVRYNNNIDARIDMEADPAQDTLLLQYVLLILQNSQARSNRMKGEMLINDTGLMINLKLRKEFAQEAEDLLLQAGAARATSTNTVNTVRTPVSTASSSGGPSYPDLTNYADQDNSQIPALQDIYGNSNDGIFTNASYDDEGAVADFTNLESTMNIRCGRESAFLYGTIDEEVYVSQPPGFVDPKFLKKVYKVEKALYGLHQAPRAWSWCDKFEALMKSRFQMSSIREFTFFLGLQVKQKEDGIFISQDKYVAEILKKFDFDSVKTASTPIETQKPLTKDEEVVDMDVHLYRSMTGSLMYLIASRPDIMFAVCACSRFQETHNRRLSNSWQETYSMAMQEADNFGSNSTNEAEIKSLLLPTCWGQAKLVLSGNVGAARHKVSVARQKFVLLVTVTTVLNDEKQIHATVDSKAVVVTEASIRSSLLLSDVVGTACLTNEDIFQNLAFMGYEGELNKLTFQKALFSPQWKYLIHTILHCLSSKSTSWNEFSTNIASAVICLATNQKFNFSKLIFDGMLRNLDNPKKKFLMYPRFLMVFLNNQIELGEPFNDVYITPAHTLKVFSNMSRKGVKFSGKVTPLFDSMLVPHQAPEGEGSEQPTEPQPTPSPTQPSTGDQPPMTDSSSVYDTTQDSRDSLEGTNGSEGDQVQPSHDSNILGGPTSDRAKGGMTLEELFVLCINLSNRVLALEASKDAQAAQIIKLKTRIKKLKKKSHPGRRNAKTEPTLDDSTFDDLDADHEVLEKGGSNEEPVSVAGNTGVSTAVPEVSTATPMTPPTTTSVFEDKYIFLADALVMLSDKTKLKVVAIKEVKESDMTKRSILTLKPLPSIDPKDKDAKVARLVYEEELAELEKEKEEKHRQKQASVDYIANLKKQLAVERSATIRNKPPTRTQLRSLMMTYLKHTATTGLVFFSLHLNLLHPSLKGYILTVRSPVGFQKFLQLSAAIYTSYYCQFYLVLLVKTAKDSRK